MEEEVNSELGFGRKAGHAGSWENSFGRRTEIRSVFYDQIMTIIRGPCREKEDSQSFCTGVASVEARDRPLN